MGNPVGADEQLRVFLSLLPHDIAGREKLCAALAEQGRFEEALEECRALKESMPHFAKPYYTMAYALARMGRLEESIEVYESLLTVDPGATIEIHNEIGRIQLHADRPELAIETYRKGIDDAADHGRGPAPDLHYNYAFALKRIGRTEEAASVFRRAAEIYGEIWRENPESIAPLLASGNALIECGDPDEASLRFREAAKLDPADVAGHLGLVRALDLAGRHDEAAAAARVGVQALEAGGRGDAATALRGRIAGRQPESAPGH